MAGSSRSRLSMCASSFAVVTLRRGSNCTISTGRSWVIRWMRPCACARSELFQGMSPTTNIVSQPGQMLVPMAPARDMKSTPLRVSRCRNSRRMWSRDLRSSWPVYMKRRPQWPIRATVLRKICSITADSLKTTMRVWPLDWRSRIMRQTRRSCVLGCVAASS